MISAYLFSTKRSKQADTINTLRSFAVNTVVILMLPKIFDSFIVWHTFGIYEAVVLCIAFLVLKRSERNDIVYC